jgi:hypothetical protein
MALTDTRIRTAKPKPTPFCGLMHYSKGQRLLAQARPAQPIKNML